MGDMINTDTTEVKTISDYSVDAQTLDEEYTKENFYDNDKFNEYLGYYKSIPELKSAIDSLVMWVIGRGYETKAKKNKRVLQRIRGWGEDSFLSICQNLLTQKLINGDAYAEIMRNDEGTFINLKPLTPANMRTVVDQKGIIKRYEQINKAKQIKKFQPHEILHLCNDRLGGEIHGISKIEAVKWLIDYYNEMLSDLRRIMHRSTIRVLYIDIDDTNRLNQIKTEYKDGIKNGEVLILPTTRSEAEFEDLQAPNVTTTLEALRFVQSAFYKAIGVPEVILGGSQQYTEASSKVGLMTFDQPYITEQRRLEEDILLQLGIELKFERAPSIVDTLQTDEAKNTGQTGFQPNEAQLTAGRTE